MNMKKLTLEVGAWQRRDDYDGMVSAIKSNITSMDLCLPIVVMSKVFGTKQANEIVKSNIEMFRETLIALKAELNEMDLDAGGEVIDRKGDAERLAQLIESVGLKAPRIGDLYDDAFPLLADAVEKLVAVARAAKSVNRQARACVPGGPSFVDLNEALLELGFQ